MATHSSIPAWKIPWTGEPGRLQSTRSQRVGHNQATHTVTCPLFIFSSVLCLHCYSATQSCLALCRPVDCACQVFLLFSISQSLLRFIFTESVMLANQLILCHPHISQITSQCVCRSQCVNSHLEEPEMRLEWELQRESDHEPLTMAGGMNALAEQRLSITSYWRSASHNPQSNNYEDLSPWDTWTPAHIFSAHFHFIFFPK